MKFNETENSQIEKNRWTQKLLFKKINEGDKSASRHARKK